MSQINITNATVAGIFIATMLMLAPSIGMAAKPSDAGGGNPNFQTATSSINQDGVVKCSFKEVGLGNLGFSDIDITCSADVQATFVCLNNGNHVPSDPKKTDVSGTVSQSGTFPVRNGQTTGSIDLSVPVPQDFTCPPGQKVTLAFAQYTQITVSDELGNFKLASPSSQTFDDPRIPN